MACNLQEVMNGAMDELRGIVQGKATSIDVGADYATFNWGPDYKVKKRHQAVKAAKGKQKKIEEWAEKKFGKKFSKGWVRLTETETRVMLDYGFPPLLRKAYEQKIAQEDQSAQFEQRDQMASEYVSPEGDVLPYDDSSIFNDDLPLTGTRNTEEQDVSRMDFEHYIKQKENLIKIMERKLSDLYEKRKNDKSMEIKEEINRVSSIKRRFEDEVAQLSNSVDPLRDSFELFESDINLIQYLVSGDNPPIQNLYEAEDMIAYLSAVTDTSSSNNANKFILRKGEEKLSLEVQERLNTVAETLGDLNTAIYEAKKKYLLQIIDESPKLKALYPEMQVVEIRDMMLAEHKDIGAVSAFFGSTGKQIRSRDSLLTQMIRGEVDKKRGEAKNEAARFIGRFNELTPKIKKKLNAMGHGVTWKPMSKIFSETSFDIFQQMDDFNNRTDRLISKYSARWQTRLKNAMANINSEIYEANNIPDKNQSLTAKNKALAKKYNWINSNAEFFDISRVPEIVNDPVFAGWQSRYNQAEAERYRLETIAKIGRYQYDKLVEEQKDKLEEYRIEMKNTISEIYDENNATKYSELPPEVQYRVKIITAVNDPFALIDSQKSMQGGRIDVIDGNNSQQYQSQLKFNTFFPKKTTEMVDNDGNITEEDTGFYDPAFEQIENDAELYEYWELLTQSAEFINMNIADGRTKLHANSVPMLKKNVTDLLLDHRIPGSERAMIFLSDTIDFFKNLFSVSDRYIDRGEEINKGMLSQSVRNDVGRKMRIATLAIKRLRGGNALPKNGVLDLTQENYETAKYIAEIAGFNDATELYQVAGTRLNVRDFLRSHFTNATMQEQTVNLPVIMKAYLDMTAEYKARKDAHPKVKLMKDLYNRIEPKKSKQQKEYDQDGVLNSVRKYYQEKIGTYFSEERRFAKWRMNDFYKRNVLAKSDAENWMELTFLGKNYSKGELELKKELEAHIEQMEAAKAFAEADDQHDKAAELQDSIDDMNTEIENLGKIYTLAASYNSVINRYQIFKGLAWNMKAATINRFQGWFQGIINDTGKYWTRGNFLQANAFVNRKALARINPKGRRATEVKKAEVLIERLEILQDATNEIDRARNESGVTGIFKKMNPFYLTEYVEWHNQTPEVLSILMDQQLLDENGNPFTDEDGKPITVFDGKGFPAHDLVDGELILKEEYATRENVEKWQNFSSPAFREIKNKISATISVLNGDYSKTGTTLAKSFIMGKSLMLFKTWFYNQLWQRFAYKQTDIDLGIKDYNGFYTGTFSSDRTRGIGNAALTAGIAAASLTTLPLGLGAAGIAGLGVYAYNQHKKYKKRTAEDDIVEDIQYAQQLGAALKGILNKAISIPVNTIAGKKVVKEYDFNELNLTEEEKQNAHTLLNEITLIMGLVAMKAMLAAMLTGDEEDEPKTIDGIENPYYESESKKQARKAKANFIENYGTRIIDDISMYYNPKALWNMISIDGIARLLDDIDGFAKAIYELDGEKMKKEGMDLTIPSVFKGWGGFKPLTEREYENNELMDKLFKSDYKKDRERIRKLRKEFREEIYEEILANENYDEIEDDREKAELEAWAKKEAQAEAAYRYPYPNRYEGYDEDQNSKD